MNLVISLLLVIILSLLIQQNNIAHSLNKSVGSQKRLPKLNRPITLATQKVKPFRQIGFIYDGKDEMMPLLARRVHNGSYLFNYYTLSNHENPIKIPIRNANKNCMNEYGCKELYDGDEIVIEEFSKSFNVKIYESNPTYHYNPLSSV